MTGTFPAFDGKHTEPALIDPEHEVVASDVSPDDVPPAAVVCYQPELFAYARSEYGERELFADHYLFDCVVCEGVVGDRGEIAVVGNFGVGAPVTAMVVETLGAAGVETFLSAGYAGCLQRDVRLSDIVVPDTAIRDEGTSHHYLAPDEFIDPTPSVAADARAAAVASDRAVHEGPTWTIDAAYRETVPEIDHYAERGVLTVEMEAAAVFAVARHRGYEAAALLVVSDYLGTDEWDPNFDATEPHLRELFEIGADALRRHLAE